VKLRLLSYNIRYGGIGREQALATTIAAVDPDLVMFQEAQDPRVIERLAKTTGHPHWGARPGYSAGFMSRVAMISAEWHRPRPFRRSFLELVTADPAVRLFDVHLSATHNAWMERQRTRELRALLATVAKQVDGFHVLAGDFNTLPPGSVLDWRRVPRKVQLLGWLGGRAIQWRTVQILLDARYRDGFRALHADVAGHTFPAWDPHLRLDYLFVPESAIGRVCRCEVIDGESARQASDHLPLFAEIEV